MDFPISAVKGATVGAAEVATAALGFLVLDAVAQDAVANAASRPDGLLSLIFVFTLIPVAMMVAGLIVGWLVKLPKWWIVLPAANAVCLLVLALVRDATARSVISVAVFGIAGATQSGSRYNAGPSSAQPRR